MLFSNELSAKFAKCPSPYVPNLDAFNLYSMFLARLLPPEIKAKLAQLKSGEIDMVKIDPVTDHKETTPTPCDDSVIGAKPNYFSEGVMGGHCRRIG